MHIGDVQISAIFRGMYSAGVSEQAVKVRGMCRSQHRALCDLRIRHLRLEAMPQLLALMELRRVTAVKPVIEVMPCF